MNLSCDAVIALALQSRSQQVRVATEAWFGSQGYCIACPSDSLSASKPNAKARDFSCPVCDQTYELKSSEKAEGKRVVDGAYATMLQRIRAHDAPALILLKYLRAKDLLGGPWLIDRVTAIHPVFLTDAVVEARKPLSAGARRAGWQGCNLRLDRIPPEGRILIVESGKVSDASLVRQLYRSSQKLSAINPTARGWTNLVLNIVRRIGRKGFTLDEAYAHRSLLQEAYPNNHNVEAKIRQQLQVLRELGYIRFTSRGSYEVVG